MQLQSFQVHIAISQAVTLPETEISFFGGEGGKKNIFVSLSSNVHMHLKYSRILKVFVTTINSKNQ